MKMTEFEHQNTFLQGEVHSLVRFKDTLRDMGLLNEKGFLNKTFLVNLKELNDIVINVNQLHVMITRFQTDLIKVFEDFQV